MNITELRDSKRYSRLRDGDTGRGVRGDLGIWHASSALSLYSYSVHEAAVPLSGGISLSLGRRHLPLHSRRPCPGGLGALLASGPGPSGLNFLINERN